MPLSPTPRIKTFVIKLTGFALMVLGAKLWLIRAYGQSVPLWDSWGQEGKRIYKPWMEGAFTPRMLFINNNVHHISCTRLFDIALFVLNGQQWDVRAQLVANALVHVVGSTLILAIIYSRIGRAAGDVALAAMGLCLAFPFVYVNTLWGFQSQFSFLIFLSVVTLWGLLGDIEGHDVVSARQASLRRWCGRGAAFLACFTMGSGFLAAAVSAVLIAGRAWWTGQWRRAIAHLLAGVLATLLGLALFATTLTQLRQNSPLQAPPQNPTFLVVKDRLADRARLLLDVGAVTGWPIGGGTQPWGGILLYAPFGFWLVRQWRNRQQMRPVSAPRQAQSSPTRTLDGWFLAGLGLWSLAQGTTIGLLRGVPPGTRHLDMLSFGLVVNLVVLTILWREVSEKTPGRAPGPRPMIAVASGAFLWLSLCAAGLFTEGRHVWDVDLPAWKEQLPRYQEAIEQFAATDDPVYLQAPPNPFLILPEWPKMVRFLRDPTIRECLSSSLRMPGSTSVKPPTLARRALIALPSIAVPCFAAGGLLLIIAFGACLAAKYQNSSAAIPGA